MINGKKILAIVPARSGSKRLKNKNIKIFRSKPLLVWTINQAIESKYIDKIVVSTDSKLYLRKVTSNINKNSKLNYHLRAQSISKDNTSSESVIKNIIAKNKKYHTIILLQPTSPLRQTEDIDKSLNKYFKSKKKTLVSVCKYEKSQDIFYNLLNQKIKKINLSKYKNIFTANGAIYIVDNNYFLKNNKILSKNPILFEMPTSRSVDIDNNLDFILAEHLYYENI